eukprot:TRINITY_DN18723_c0_g2_i1.p2 TRINITY_DN18723_c0_g2~~TRINITY_DN18723_c0_g2_i1.p2  ORF type:complete len:123 (+),score=12.30 TRINITY_DN18723_c0_g2_i1:988-1356(+)
MALSILAMGNLRGITMELISDACTLHNDKSKTVSHLRVALSILAMGNLRGITMELISDACTLHNDKSKTVSHLRIHHYFDMRIFSDVGWLFSSFFARDVCVLGKEPFPELGDDVEISLLCYF